MDNAFKECFYGRISKYILNQRDSLNRLLTKSITIDRSFVRITIAS